MLFRIAVVLLVIFIIFTFVLGFFRVPDGSMAPAIHEGDIMLGYRLNKSYNAGDLTAVKYEDKELVLRVVAVAGDTVAINEQGLVINGNYHVNNYSSEHTYAIKGDVSYPITVGEDEVFLLGDAREHSTDSRVFGPVKIDSTEGQMISLLLRRTNL